MDRGYFAHNEANDMLLLRKLSTDVGLFSTVGECEKYACADASGVTKDGKIAIGMYPYPRIVFIIRYIQEIPYSSMFRYTTNCKEIDIKWDMSLRYVFKE